MLAHSLRDAGTTKKLAVLVTADSISADAMVELQVRLADPTKPLKLLTYCRNYSTSSFPSSALTMKPPPTST